MASCWHDDGLTLAGYESGTDTSPLSSSNQSQDVGAFRVVDRAVGKQVEGGSCDREERQPVKQTAIETGGVCLKFDGGQP